MKKTTIWILVLALVVTFVGPAVQPMKVFATENSEDAKVLSIELEASSSAVEPGEEFTVSVYVTENTGFRFAKLKICFPEEALTAVAVDCTGGVFGAAIDSASVYIGTSYVNIPVGNALEALMPFGPSYTDSGFVGTITFRVNEGYEGDIAITMGTLSNDIYDLDSMPGTVTVNNGTATIRSFTCEHSWVDATCDAPKTCTICGATEGEALGHDLTQHEAKAPTCTEHGWEAYESCSRCVYSTYVELGAVGHSYESVVTEATCTEAGYTTYTCTACGDSYTEEIPAIGHNYVDGACEHCGEADPDAVLMGDANGDGVVNYLDAMLIAQYYVGDIEEDGLDLNAADVNGDGVVNYLDAMMVAQFYVGDIDEFPTEN